MTRRTDTSNHASCALVLEALVRSIDAIPFASTFLASKPELGHLLGAARYALAGVELQRMRCGKACGWAGLFPTRGQAFLCVRCGSTTVGTVSR